jgi:hypothetical protein
MKRLLAACTALHSFELVIPNGERFRSSLDVAYDPLVAPWDIVTALLKAHDRTLKTLRLDFHYFYSFRDEELLEELESGQNLEPCFYTYPSFRESESLTRMYIEFEKLVKLRHLPASLVSLELDHCHFPELNHDYLNELLRLKGTWCPVIESVVIKGWEWTVQDTQAMQELAWPLDAHIFIGEKETTFSFSNIGYRLQIRFCRFSDDVQTVEEDKADGGADEG